MGHLFAKALEPFDLYWFEEPCWPERLDDIAAIQRSVRTPIATGERLVGAQAVQRAADEGRLQRDPAGHHALRRPHRGAADRGARRGAPRRARPAQPAGPGLDRGLDRVRPRDALVHHLRGGHLRRPVAGRGRDRVAPDRPGRDAGPGDRPARARDRDRPRRRREAPVRAGAAAAGLLRRRQRRGLVGGAMSEVDGELVRREHRYEHLTWPEINEAVAQEKVVVLPVARDRAARAPPAARRRREARDVGLPRRGRAVTRVDARAAAGQLRLLPPRDGLSRARSTSSRPRS